MIVYMYVLVDETFNYEKFKAFFQKNYHTYISNETMNAWLNPCRLVNTPYHFVLELPVVTEIKKIDTSTRLKVDDLRKFVITPFELLEMTFISIVEPDKVQCKIIN